MKSIPANSLLWAAVLIAQAVQADPPPVPEATCADVGQLAAIDLVEPSLLSSPLHTVRPCARIVGHMARFELDTRFGPLVADSIALLHIRVEELPAIERLERASHAGMATEAAGDSVRATARGIGQVASRPLQTLAELPAGALRFFQRKLDELGQAAIDTSERTSDQITGAGDAYDRVSSRPGVVLAEPPADPWWQRGGGKLLGLGKDWVGYGKVRRTWARRLGVDPYSSNPLLNARMDALAWSALAGGKAVAMASGQLGASAGTALGITRRLNDIVWEMPPEQLRQRNDARLAALGCEAPERRRFLRNGRFAPGQQTALTDALVELQPASGCADLLELAAALDTEVEVRYLVDAIALLAAQDIHDARLQLIGVAPVLIHLPPAAPADAAATTAIEGPRRREPGALERLAGSLPPVPRLVVPLPVDRLEWTPATVAFFDTAAFRVVDKRVLVGGEATQNALQGLTRRGWEVVERQSP
jgi:hypothetical protein